MTTYEAKRLCPHLIFVVGNNRKYAEVCRQLEQICLRFTPDLEIYSIDEVFLDITRSHHLFGGPETLGASIKAAVKTESASPAPWAWVRTSSSPSSRATSRNPMVCGGSTR